MAEELTLLKIGYLNAEAEGDLVGMGQPRRQYKSQRQTSPLTVKDAQPLLNHASPVPP